MQSILQIKDVKKSFGNVKALKGVNMEIFPNEIVGLIGENGAGKSTLMKILLGIHKKDGGQLILNGEETEIANPQDAVNKGICMVFQEQSLLNNIAVYENLFLGMETAVTGKKMLSRKEMILAAKKELQEIGLDDVDPTAQVQSLTFLQRQMVEIARNMWRAKKSGAKNVIIILDEPTSAMGAGDAEILFEKMREIKQIASIIFISHKLNEMVAMCDRIYVLKDGCDSAYFGPKDEVDENILRDKMVGGAIQGEYYLVSQQRKPGEKVILSVNDISASRRYEHISFEVHEGEIFCISGTIGSGKENLCNVLYGIERPDSGEIIFDGKKMELKSTIDAVKIGIGMSPADRKGQGILAGMTLTDNIALPMMKGILHTKEMDETSLKLIEKLKVKTESEKTLARQLSGGNQQKIVMARLLVGESKMVILANPTRGVDVGVKREIYALIRELADRGVAIILMGDSFEEDIGLSNTIMTMKDGRCTGMIDATSSKPTLDEFAKFII